MEIESTAHNQFGRIGILMGGPSSEKEVSLKSGKAVYESLKSFSIDAVPINIKTDDLKENMRLIKSYKINCAFLALHGYFGEDGKIQGILDALKIPYTGSGTQASRLAMDKISSRRIFEVYNLNVPKYKVAERFSYRRNLTFLHNLSLPLVIKPATNGSSIGLSIIDKKEDLGKALDLAFSFDDKVIIEEYIRGREVTVGILGNRALPVIEIIPKKRFFDFEAKYQAGMTEYVVPAKLEEGISRKIKYIALLAHKLLGCFGCSRVDIILNRENAPFILEVNTIPGFTKTSLLPKAAKTIGIDFSQLCFKLIRMAYEKAIAD